MADSKTWTAATRIAVSRNVRSWPPGRRPLSVFCVVNQLVLGFETIVLEHLSHIVVKLTADQQLANQLLRLGNPPAVLQLGVIEVREYRATGGHTSLEGIGVELLGVLSLFARHGHLANTGTPDAGVFVGGDTADLPFNGLAVLPLDSVGGNVFVILYLLHIGLHKRRQIAHRSNLPSYI